MVIKSSRNDQIVTLSFENSNLSANSGRNYPSADGIKAVKSSVADCFPPIATTRLSPQVSDKRVDHSTKRGQARVHSKSV